jgi:hypothetical protein
VLTFHTLPVPAFPQYTAKVPAGVVTIGVEYRVLDEATILDFYGPDARARFGGQAPAGMGAVVQEDGLSFHVFGTDDGEERLRFDCFDDAPHYHYLTPSEPLNVVVDLDAVACGAPVQWALRTLRERLVPMLEQAGAADLAAAVDPALVAAAMVRVEAEAFRMLEAGAPTPVG